MMRLFWKILGGYFLAMLAVGVYFQRRQTGLDEYFVGGRSMGSGHIGLSVVGSACTPPPSSRQQEASSRSGSSATPPRR